MATRGQRKEERDFPVGAAFSRDLARRKVSTISTTLTLSTIPPGFWLLELRCEK